MRQEKILPTNFIPQKLASILIDKGILSSDQVEVALKEQYIQRRTFEECLISLGFISESVLAEVLSFASGYKKINLKQTLVDPTLKKFISREITEKFCFFPVSMEEGNLKIAVADIHNLPAFDFLRHHVPSVQKVLPYIAAESDIFEAIDQYYGYDLSIPTLLKELEGGSSATFSRNDHVNPTVRLVNAILIDAIKLKASDVHFEQTVSEKLLKRW